MRVAILASALLAYVLLSFGVLKLLSGPGATVVVIANLGFDQPVLVPAAARALPWFEIALGLWLLSGFRPWRAACVALFVLSLFSAGTLALGATHGWQAPCSCGGAVLGESVRTALVRNLLLATLAACLVLGRQPNLSQKKAILRSS